MRFSNLTFLILFFLCSCGGGQLYQPDSEYESEQIVEEATQGQPIEQTSQKQVIEQIQKQPSDTQAQPEVLTSTYGTYYNRLADNVRIKQSDAFGITYEYKDVRIDEIAYLAAQYCYEQNGKRAYLYDSQLYKNYARRATFHCVELQN